MKKLIQRHVSNLIEQPERVRIRAAVITSFLAGGVLVILWLTVLLPFQLKSPKDSGQGSAPAQVSEEKQGAVAGTVTPVTPTPMPTQLFQELPASDSATEPTSSQEPSSLPVPITP